MMMITDDDSYFYLSQNGNDALYWACRFENWDVAELLLLKGANPDVKDKVSVLFNKNFADPNHLCLYCIILFIDDVYVYLAVHPIVIITLLEFTLYAECTRNLSFLFHIKSELVW